MNWRNVFLILSREIKDQLRDRRTLFMIAVLPVLLYPMVGMTFLQLKQFMQEHQTTIGVLGHENIKDLDDLPPLFEDQSFSKELLDETGIGEAVKVVFVDSEDWGNEGDTKSTPKTSVEDSSVELSEKDTSETPSELSAEEVRIAEMANAKIKEGVYDAVVYFPPNFGEQLEKFRQEHLKLTEEDANSTLELTKKDGEVSPKEKLTLPSPIIWYNSANERSSLARARAAELLGRWKRNMQQKNLIDSRLSVEATKLFELTTENTAPQEVRRSAIWGKVLPFIVFIWAMTGAFYPAVDLCAGEKERGTLETLLASPASRSEIVWGKLLTVMTFSISTALLNLLSLGLTGGYILSSISSASGGGLGQELAAPPFLALVWLFLSLIPISAFFSAICLALAAFAKSTKEGQYYLVPVLLVIAPLMSVAIWPGVELDLGKSLIPVAGLALLLRTMIEGNFSQALPYVLPVLGVTAICCMLAIRWAIEQFQRESVLFRESERFDIRRWVVHLVRDRTETPTVATAFGCAVLILMVKFFIEITLASRKISSFNDILMVVFITQVVVILIPTIFMALFLTSRPRKSLLLETFPTWKTIPMGILLACCIHPFGLTLGAWIRHLYPMPAQLMRAYQEFEAVATMPEFFLWPILLLGVLPAICEELACRGFVLSGFRHLGNKWWAIGLSSIFFGMLHASIQQAISATALGILLGFIAVHSRSILPGMVFHATYNSLLLLLGRYGDGLIHWLERFPKLSHLIISPSALNSKGSTVYTPLFVYSCLFIAAIIIYWFSKLHSDPSKEEALYNARLRSAHESRGN